MKKIRNVSEDARSRDGLETTRRLYRAITETAKKLEEQKIRALTVVDVFTQTGETLRSKLRDYCERLIIADPLSHVKKTEELLWRRGFYDVVSAAKKLRKESTWNEMEKAFLSTHLSLGVGFYHHLILRLQLEFDLDFMGIIDFAYPSEKGTLCPEKRQSSTRVQSEDVKRSVLHFVHRCLICLGDLARYRLDLEDDWNSEIATRYYKMAIVFDCKHGMPHNQLGTMAGNKNYGLDAVYHYTRSLLCAESFDLAEGNLKRTIVVHSLSGKEKCLVQSCIARLLLLLQLWDNCLSNMNKINQESQTLLSDIENCLSTEKSETIDHNAAQVESCIEQYLLRYKNCEKTSYLSDDVIFKMIVICLMKIDKLQSKDPAEIHGVVAFVLAVFSQLLQFVVTRLQDSLLDVTAAEMGNDDAEENKLEKNYDYDGDDDNDDDDTMDNGEKDVSAQCMETPLENNREKNEKFEINGNHLCDSKLKKSLNKSKYLLTKLRRPRNRRNSSDSDASDRDGIDAGSSSEELNSDITETEHDLLSLDDEIESYGSDNVLSSEDLSEDEKCSVKNNGEYDDESADVGHLGSDSKTRCVVENENESVTINGILCKNEKSVLNNAYGENTTVATAAAAAEGKQACVAQRKKRNLDHIKILQILSDEKMLVSIKICCDWLRGHQDIVKTCARGSKSLLERLIALLNLINLESQLLLRQKWHKDLEIFSSLEKVKELTDVVPLPEDVDLRGLKFFETAHKNIDWEYWRKKKMTIHEESLLRALKLVEFGHYLCSFQESGVIFDSSKGLFVQSDLDTTKVKENHANAKNLESDRSKGKLMRHMGKLWLKAEVNALENRLHSRLMSPYLVPDHEALSKFMPIVKQLVYTKKFIVIVPVIVISALDEMKKTSSHAREATRWLETQLQRGSRFLRTQRTHEKLPLPFIKAPKPKDKEAWVHFQIVECCHYLSQQSQSGDNDIPIVTLLTGFEEKRTSSITFSPDGLAKSAGVNFEHIVAFHAKWKLSVKSHG